ncbi:MAG: hypothetical protein LBS99_02030 [Clostridiales bacterium]|jgi:hypothetical protein|nr:hypothetical protein [Clostridiales bacterium]
MKKKLLAIMIAVVMSCAVVLSACTTTEIKPLATPAGLAYAANKLTWGGVSGASNGYSVVIKQGTSEVRNETATTAEYDVSALGDGEYNASVTAKAVAGVSKASAAATLDFRKGAVTYPALTAPAGFAYSAETGLVTWTAVVGATAGYHATVTEQGGSVAAIDEDEASAQIDVSELEAGGYNVSVYAKAVANVSAQSPAGEYQFTVEPAAPAVTQLPSVANLAFDKTGDLITFDDVAGSDGYDVSVYSGETRVLHADGIITPSVSTAELGAGSFTVKVITLAASDDELHSNSEEATLPITVDSLGALAAPADLKIDDGYLKWTATNARGVTVKVYEVNTTDEVVGVTPRLQDEKNNLYLNALGVADGNYTVGITFTSNRHSQSASDETLIHVAIQTAASYTATQIATFDGVANGEHATVTKVEAGGVEYARVVPTADGWGRVASPAITVNFDKKPVVLIDVGAVIGGYHLQAAFGGGFISLLGDAARTEGQNVDIVKGREDAFGGGSGSIRLRLGVNQATGSGNADVSVDYRFVSVSYISVYVPPVTGGKLDDAANPKIALRGNLAWDSVAYANGYKLQIHDEADIDDTNDINTTVENPSYNAKLLPDGIYTASITATNDNASGTTFSDSDEVSFRFEIETVVKYTQAQIDTGSSGMFVTDPASASNGTINNGTNYGWIKAKTGVEINMDKNPFILMTIASANGGYFFKAVLPENSDITMINDTPLAVPITEQTIIELRANVNVDRQASNSQDFQGVKTGYQIRPGVMTSTPASNLTLSEIRIVYCTAYVEEQPPENAVKLTAPAGFAKPAHTTNISWAPVAGNAKHTPKYDITVTNTASALDTFFAADSTAANVDLKQFALTDGATYEISVVAKGDTLGAAGAPLWFTDSDPGLARVTYTEITDKTDFTGITTVDRDGEVAKITVTGSAAGLVTDINGDGWGIKSFEIDLAGKTVSNDSVIWFKISAQTGNPMIFGRYFTGGTGTGNTVALDDTNVTAGQIITLTKDTFVNSIDVGGKVYFGLGFGGSPSGARSFTVERLVMANYALTTSW